MTSELIVPNMEDPKLDTPLDWSIPAAEGDATAVRAPGILVVDDDRAVRTVLNFLLRQHGVAVWLAAGGFQALKVYQGHRHDIDFVLMDVRMPELDGPATLVRLRQLNPRLRCCFMSGDLGPYTEKELLARGAERILYKPFHLRDLRRLVELLSQAPDVPQAAGTEELLT